MYAPSEVVIWRQNTTEQSKWEILCFPYGDDNKKHVELWLERYQPIAPAVLPGDPAESAVAPQREFDFEPLNPRES